MTPIKVYAGDNIILPIGRAELNFGFDGAQSNQVHVVPDEIRCHLHG